LLVIFAFGYLRDVLPERTSFQEGAFTMAANTHTKCSARVGVSNLARFQHHLTDAGLTTGAFVDSANQRHAFLLKGSTLTPIVRPYGASPAGINKYNSVVGAYTDSSGHDHGFKRYSDGNTIHLSYPGAINTGAVGINDSGVIVGTYLGTDSAEHGFIYKSGQWAKLQFPNASQSTELFGISNSGVIVGQDQAHAYMYANGTAKEIAVPGYAQTEVRAIAPGGLIAGMAGLTHGFLASCH
jgi:hypothetical protein